jgi:excisionase family DNA binding protein
MTVGSTAAGGGASSAGRSGGSRSEALLSPADVARACGLSRRAIYRAISRGELPAARLCNRLRVRPADLNAWVSAQTLSPPLVGGGSTRATRAWSRGSLRAMLDDPGEQEEHGH